MAAPPLGVVDLASPIGVVTLAPPVGVVNLAPPVDSVNLTSWFGRSGGVAVLASKTGKRVLRAEDLPEPLSSDAIESS